MSRLGLPLVVGALVAIPGSFLVAATVGPLTTFADGTVANAAAVNGNFAAVRTAVDANATALDKRFRGFEYFTVNATWPVPADVTFVYVEVAGGGGGGAGGNCGTNQVTGGGQGGWGEVRGGFLEVTPGGSVGVVIGSGGNAGTANGGAGGSGNASTVTGTAVTITAAGGNGGGLPTGGSTQTGSNGYRLLARSGNPGGTWGTAVGNGYSIVPGGSCTGARGEGGCGGNGLWCAGNAGSAGAAGFVKLWY